MELNDKKSTENWKDRIPTPVYDEHPEYNELYNKEWELVFEHPYREYGIERDEALLNTNRELALSAARESIVLLKNDNVLPLKANVKIAVIGDLADSAREMLGMWAVDKSAITPVSLLEGIKSRAKCEFFNVAERIEKRKDEFDVVIVAIGESKSQSGEAASRAYIGLSENDILLLNVVGSIVRPIKELKGYQRIALKAKEKKQVTFILEKSELGFYDYNLNYVVEAGKFKLWIGHDSDAMLCEEFEL